MQVIVGTAASLDDLIPRVQNDEIEIVDADGITVAYLVAAPRPGDATYSRFETIFQSHAETLRRRAANPARGITTQELLSKLDAMTCDVESPCGSR